MNFLAHLFLSGSNDDWMVGNYLGDFLNKRQIIGLIQLKVYYYDSLGSNPRISDTVYLKDLPKNIKGLHKRVHIDIVHIRETNDGDAEIVLASEDLALFVVLTTRAEGK